MQRDMGEKRIPSKVVRPDHLPDPDTTEEARQECLEPSSEKFATMLDAFQNSSEVLFGNKEVSCSAARLARWFVDEGYCDSLHQAAPFLKKLDELDIVVPEHPYGEEW
eukprot:CAMPEP_0198369972 /NCGR_PEP_ID=MMETSP1450-20131203/156478_1 /TAXON_ID=753684 ORGANISM="Madagascaria erythrocladiodes, Strain CCMP3234" /NCGR_SAMPLE_ID=MMETSP1450 /ASSEMBLY_ACC=CAM_ASM_001115 /LENGTH=107 /DNA_ID=CAMNT_0044077503 /DNA_START=766 /DNA_END=1086 /DNA_ORIENTATION=+